MVQYLDRDSVEFLDKEILTDVTEGETSIELEHQKIPLIAQPELRPTCREPDFISYDKFLVEIKAAHTPYRE